MSTVSHQNVRLGRGRHASPGQGVCVMELVSMLAGEPFSDHPRSVSQPIGELMRAYNDLLDDDRRQDLYAYAATIVGTRSSPSVELVRVERMISWGDERWADRSRRRVLDRVRRRLGPDEPQRDPAAAARYALHAMGKLTDDVHAAVLGLVDELVATEAPDTDDTDGSGGATGVQHHLDAPRPAGTETSCAAW
jgi:hypothetical protein